MRANVWTFVSMAARNLPIAGPVYEFGSFQVPGQPYSDLRPFFSGHDYTGCDIRPGPGVDLCLDLAKLNLDDGVAGTIVCVETLEHVLEARKAVDEMIRVLAPGGMMIVAAPLDFRIHDFPSDYWRITPSCLTRLLAPLDASLVGWQGSARFPHTVFGVGFKAPLAVAPQQLDGLVHDFRQWLATTAAAVPWGRRAKNWLAGWVGCKGDRRRRREYYQAKFSWHVAEVSHASPCVTDCTEYESLSATFAT